MLMTLLKRNILKISARRMLGILICYPKCSTCARARKKIRGDSMKIGMRKPSLKKRVSARVSPKRQIVHRAGIKMPRGYGWVRNPKRYVYNKVYRRTTFDIFKLMNRLFK